MATISSQSTRTSGRAQTYAKKDAVAITAVNATAPMFEQRLQEIRAAHGKSGSRPKVVVDEEGKDVVAKDSKGNTVYESRYVQAYSLVQSFGHDELDPDDPESWTRANDLGRAVAEDRFPGHPALIATEVNGRSGCVHNHLIVGATHPETGKQLDSNVVTHSRLALAHDRVLAENGFDQRADMREMAMAASAKTEERRTAVEAEEGFADLSPSQQQRKLVAAEKSVRFESTTGKSATQQRDERRRREFDRYLLNKQDREAALDIGATPPKERFSELELEARIRDSLNDPRATTWEGLDEVGREHGVTINRRGSDVSYGMMLAQPDGSLAEPARAHRRRGGREPFKGLGDGFRVEDVEASLERNAELTRAAQHQHEQQQEALQHRPIEPEQFESKLHGARATSPALQKRVEGLAKLEDDWVGRMPTTEEDRREFARQIREIGVGRSTVETTGPHLHPEIREQLERYVEKNEDRNATRDRRDSARQEVERLEERRRLDERQKVSRTREDLRFHDGRLTRLDDELDRGVFEKDTPAAQAEAEQRRQQIAGRGAGLEDGDGKDKSLQDRLRDSRNEMREVNQRAEQSSAGQDQEGMSR